MPFAKQALSWRSKAHLDGVRLPVLVGITALIVLVLGLACASLLQAASSHGFAVTRADEEQNADEAPIDSTDEMAARVFVHVGGAVVHPGVQELEEGSRVQDAVEAAGGFADGAARDALNLARVLQDGEQVVVPTEEELTASVSPSAEVSAAPAARGRININTATAEELDALPGLALRRLRRSWPIARPTVRSPLSRISNAFRESATRSTPNSLILYASADATRRFASHCGG